LFAPLVTSFLGNSAGQTTWFESAAITFRNVSTAFSTQCSTFHNAAGLYYSFKVGSPPDAADDLFLAQCGTYLTQRLAFATALNSSGFVAQLAAWSPTLATMVAQSVQFASKVLQTQAALAGVVVPDVNTCYSEALAEYNTAVTAKKDADTLVQTNISVFATTQAAAEAARLATEASLAAVQAMKPDFTG